MLENLPYALVRLSTRRGGDVVAHLVARPDYVGVVFVDAERIHDRTGLIARADRLYDDIVRVAPAIPHVLEGDAFEDLRYLVEEAAPAARNAEVARVASLQVAGSRFTAPRAADRLVAWRAEDLIPTWPVVTKAVADLAFQIGPPRGVAVAAGEGRRGDDDAPLFALATRTQTDALVMTLWPSQRRVRCKTEFATGNWGDWGYRVDVDGTWIGPLALGAHALRLTGVDAIARNVIDGWLISVVPHH